MRSWFTILAIPFVDGTMTQDIDPEAGEWLHLWELPDGIVLQYVPLTEASVIRNEV